MGTEPREFSPALREFLPNYRNGHDQSKNCSICSSLGVYPSGVFILVEETGKVGTSVGELFWKQRVKLGVANSAVFLSSSGLLRLVFSSVE